MKLKWEYAGCKTGEGSICYTVGSILFVFVFLFETFFGGSGYFGSGKYMETMVNIVLFTLFLYYCGWLCNTKSRNFKKWYTEMIRTGVKCEGEVVSLIQVTTIGRNRKRRKTDIYNVTIKYYSLLKGKEVYYKENNICFPKVDVTKRVFCDVYETTKPVEQKDYDKELIQIKKTEDNEAEISMDINPLKLFSVVHRKYTATMFGNQVANNFRYNN